MESSVASSWDQQTIPPPGTTIPPPLPPPMAVVVTESSVASSWGDHRATLTKGTALTPHTTLTLQNESLLSSISSTLQETSKYGSNSLLTSYESPTKNNGLTAKGELEKIRSEHRRDPPPPPGGTSPKYSPPIPHRTSQLSSTGTSPQRVGGSPQRVGGSPQRVGGSPQRVPHGSPQAMRKKWSPGNRSFAGPPRGAVSLDTLREPSVTYDANTDSHIFRSLVWGGNPPTNQNTNSMCSYGNRCVCVCVTIDQFISSQCQSEFCLVLTRSLKIVSHYIIYY